eukprot:m.64437 g.64437  ORF g.64437 m.64437 type:complete len:673 (+) comp35250_c0_seq9:3789-5807(+)
MGKVVIAAVLLLFQTKISFSQIHFVPAESKSLWWRNNFAAEANLDRKTFPPVSTAYTFSYACHMFFFVASTCPPKENLTNGAVSVDGNIAVYKCDDGYTLVGGNRRHCSCGEWIGGDPVCRKNGEWGEWGPYSNCSATCGGGRQRRSRACDSPKPEEGAKNCRGSSVEARICSVNVCPGCSLTGSLVLGPLTITVLDDRLRLSCAEGYGRVGDEVVPCTTGGLPNSIDICLPSCSNLTSPQNGSLVISDDRRSVTYQCKIGFDLVGSRTRECSDEGQWSGIDAICVEGGTVGLGGEQIGKVGNKTLSLLGIEPQISLPPGFYQIKTPEYLAVNCTVVVTFKYRTTTLQESLQIVARLFSFNTDDVTDENRDTTALSLAAQKEISLNRSEEMQSGCLQLVCANATLLPAVSFVRLSVNVTDGFFEFVDIKIDEQLSCQDDEDDPLTADCDNTTDSGDCGYRNTGCNIIDWELSVGENEPVVGLRKEQETASGSCVSDVCLSCLQDSGFSVSQDDGQVIRERKRRRAIGFRKVFKSFCLPPNGKKAAGGTYVTKFVKVNPVNEYISFDYSMPSGGLHQLVVKIQCNGRGRSIVSLRKDFDFSIDNLRGKGKFGRACLDLHYFIKRSFPFKKGRCNKFAIRFDGGCRSNSLCISNFSFLKANQRNTSLCRKINNR